MDYQIRLATPDDRDVIYALKTASVRPYVEKIWGWDERYQQNEFENDFSAIEEFFVIEVDTKFAGFYQHYFEYPYIVIVGIRQEAVGQGAGNECSKRNDAPCGCGQ